MNQMNADEINARVQQAFAASAFAKPWAWDVGIHEGHVVLNNVAADHLTAADLRALADALEPQQESVISVGGATFTLKGGPQHSVTVGLPPDSVPGKSGGTGGVAGNP